MKHLFTTIIAAMLPAGPAAVANETASASSPSVSLDKKVKKTETVTFNVNMHCKNCVSKITDNISFAKGVEDLKVSLDEKKVTITYDPAKTNEEALIKAIEKCGYTAEKVTEEKGKE